MISSTIVVPVFLLGIFGFSTIFPFDKHTMALSATIHRLPIGRRYNLKNFKSYVFDKKIKKSY